MSIQNILIAEAQDIGYGQSRERLEDRCTAVKVQTAGGLALTLGVVADGVGGSNAGERASQIVLDTVLEYVQRAQEKDIHTILSRALFQAHQRIVAEGQTNPNFRQMSTTATLAAIYDQRLYLAHVGDSRAYLVRGDKIYPLTIDHSWGNEMIRQGRLSPQEVENHNLKDRLGRYLGQPFPLMIDIGPRSLNPLPPGVHPAKSELLPEGLPLQAGDVVLLCSDGLIKEIPGTRRHFVEGAEIVKVIQRKKNAPQDAANTLVSLALGRKADDNISVALMEIPREKPGAVLPTQVGKGIGIWALVIMGGVGVLLVVAALIVVFLTRPSHAKPTPVKEKTRVSNASASPEVISQFARVVMYEGVIDFEQGSQRGILEAGQQFPPGADLSLTTHPGAFLRIQLVDGSQVYMGEKTFLTISAGEGSQASILLRYGMVLVKSINLIVKANRSSFEAQAVDATMGVYFNPSEQTFQVDCLGGKCHVGESAISGGQRRGYQKGAPQPPQGSPPALAQYADWLRLAPDVVPTPTFTPLPTETPMPTTTATVVPQTSRPGQETTPTPGKATKRPHETSAIPTTPSFPTITSPLPPSARPP